MSTLNKRDKISLGLLIGMILPAFTFVLIYLSRGEDVGLSVYIITLWKIKALTLILTFSVLPNLLFFMLFNKLKYELAMRGVMMATVIYGLLMLLTKLF
ncbi:MAG: hypothetical protein ACK5IJ_03460 [Mangrovibacterium sp.]